MNTAPAQQNRWMQLILGLICMMAISSPQYVWTLFTKPLMAQLAVSLTQLQVTFSVFIVLQTFLSPLQGYLIEKFGPKLLLAAGAIMTGLSWVLASSADTLMSVYLTYGVLGGIGTGIIYVGIVGLMVAWFPDRRGMAAGVVAAGYGMGAVLTTFPVTNQYRQTWLSTDAPAFWLDFRRSCISCRAGHETTAERLDGRLHHPQQEDGRPEFRRDAENARLLAHVFNDDHDVDVRPHGHFADGIFLERFRHRRCSHFRNGRIAACIDVGPNYQRIDAAVLRLGVGPDRP